MKEMMKNENTVKTSPYAGRREKPVAGAAKAAPEYGEPMIQLPPSAAPIGYLQCTCEKYPRVLHINDQMLQFLGTSRESNVWQEFLKENIFFLLPFEDRDLFRRYLDRAYAAEEPVRIRHRIIRNNGERVSISGWLGTVTGPDGEKNYSLLYTELDSPAEEVNSAAGNSYFRALESAYNVIFEINLQRQTVECIYGKDTSDLGKLYDVRMTLESAVSFWLNNYIVREDRPHMQRYLEEILTPGRVLAARHPLQTEFRITWDDGVTYSFIGVAIQLDPNAILFCCRDTAKVQVSSLQAREIRAMKKLHAYMERTYETRHGAAASAVFEKEEEDHCSLLYASSSLFRFLQLRQDQYLRYLEEGFSFSEAIALLENCGLANAAELRKGQKIRYTIPKTGETVTISLQQTMPNIYEVLACRESVPAVSRIPQKGIFARTFGFFDMFVDGQPVAFSSFKEKELLALLIDRNGGTLSSADAISYLWEDEPVDEKTKARYRKLAMGLKKTLEQYGISHILNTKNGVRSINTNALCCDYYELLAGNTQYVQSFHNSYMSDYPWSERTLGTLWDYS